MVRLKCFSFEETLARVYLYKKFFCFTGAIDVLQGAVVRRPISAWVSFSFVQKHFFG